MRKTSEDDDFPFLTNEIHYYKVKDNDLIDLERDKEAYLEAEKNKCKIFLTWHGTYRTDLFFVDDLKKLGQAFGFIAPEHIHDIEWAFEESNPTGVYVYVNLKFKCGCTFNGLGGIERLKNDLLYQKGWEMSKSYMGTHNNCYTIKVLKRSICQQNKNK